MLTPSSIPGALYSRKITLDGEQVSLQVQDNPCVALQVRAYCICLLYYVMYWFAPVYFLLLKPLMLDWAYCYYVSLINKHEPQGSHHLRLAHINSVLWPMRMQHNRYREVSLISITVQNSTDNRNLVNFIFISTLWSFVFSFCSRLNHRPWICSFVALFCSWETLSLSLSLWKYI